mmetsp:Transcript_10793/g.25816  ORF Transcript_10793/g.25816 Transcript_10793/m.25816 type:complete len:246 (+) Transcript_10793:1053-1790(+)
MEGVDTELLKHRPQVLVVQGAEIVLPHHLHQHLHLLRGEPLVLLQEALPEVVPGQEAGVLRVRLLEDLPHHLDGFLELLREAQIHGFVSDGGGGLIAIHEGLPALLEGVRELRRCLHERLVLDGPQLILVRCGHQQLDVPVGQAQGRGVQQISHLLVGQEALVLLISGIEDIGQRLGQGELVGPLHFKGLLRQRPLLVLLLHDLLHGAGRAQAGVLEGGGQVVDGADDGLVDDQAVQPTFELAAG